MSVEVVGKHIRGTLGQRVMLPAINVRKLKLQKFQLKIDRDGFIVDFRIDKTLANIDEGFRFRKLTHP